MALKRVVLDVLKPHSPDITKFALELSEKEGVEGVNISVYELDKAVENVKVTVEGDLDNIDGVREVISEIGGTLHSIDEVVAGRRVIGETDTLHDRLHKED